MNASWMDESRKRAVISQRPRCVAWENSLTQSVEGIACFAMRAHTFATRWNRCTQRSPAGVQV